MARTLFVWLLVYIGTMACVQAAEVPAESTVWQWVQDLSDDRYERREASEAALLQVDVRYLKPLEDHLRDGMADAEGRMRLGRVVARLGTLRASSDEAEWLLKKYGSILGANCFRKPEAVEVAGAYAGVPVSPPLPPKADVDGVVTERATYYMLDWFARNQSPDGHWDSVRLGADENADMEQTALALIAHLSQGFTPKVGKYKKHVGLGLSWLMARQREDGAFLTQGAKEVDGLVHVVAACAVTLAAEMTGENRYGASAGRALAYSLRHVTRTGRGAGGFGREFEDHSPDLLATAFYGYQVSAFRDDGRMTREVRFQAIEALLGFIESLKDEHARLYAMAAGLRPSPRATFMAISTLSRLEVPKESFEPFAKQALGLWMPASMEPFGFDPLVLLFGTRTAWIVGGDRWKDTSSSLIALLLSYPKEYVPAQGSISARGSWLGMGRVAATACANVVGPSYSRYGPIFP